MALDEPYGVHLAQKTFQRIRLTLHDPDSSIQLTVPAKNQHNPLYTIKLGTGMRLCSIHSARYLTCIDTMLNTHKRQELRILNAFQLFRLIQIRSSKLQRTNEVKKEFPTHRNSSKLVLDPTQQHLRALCIDLAKLVVSVSRHYYNARYDRK